MGIRQLFSELRYPGSAVGMVAMLEDKDYQPVAYHDYGSSSNPPQLDGYDHTVELAKMNEELYKAGYYQLAKGLENLVHAFRGDLDRESRIESSWGFENPGVAGERRLSSLDFIDFMSGPNLGEEWRILQSDSPKYAAKVKKFLDDLKTRLTKYYMF